MSESIVSEQRSRRAPKPGYDVWLRALTTAPHRYDFFKARKGLDRIEKLYAKENLLEARVRLHKEERENGTVDLRPEC